MSRPRKTNKVKPGDRIVKNPRHPHPDQDSRLKTMAAMSENSGVHMPIDDPFSDPLTFTEEAAAEREWESDRLRTDPYNDEPELAAMMAGLIQGRANHIEMGHIGFWLAQQIAKSTAEQNKDLFKRIIALQVNAENLPTRNNYAVLAYNDYFQDVGLKPTKQKLRKYMLKPENQKKYPLHPEKEQGKSWHRLWEDSGLFAMRPK